MTAKTTPTADDVRDDFGEPDPSKYVDGHVTAAKFRRVVRDKTGVELPADVEIAHVYGRMELATEEDGDCVMLWRTSPNRVRGSVAVTTVALPPIFRLLSPSPRWSSLGPALLAAAIKLGDAWAMKRHLEEQRR
jgi:hypothetical protein